jgi:hypothetical protein
VAQWKSWRKLLHMSQGCKHTALMLALPRAGGGREGGGGGEGRGRAFFNIMFITIVLSEPACVLSAMHNQGGTCSTGSFCSV